MHGETLKFLIYFPKCPNFNTTPSFTLNVAPY